MLSISVRLAALLRGSTSLASLGSREATVRVSSIGLKQAFTRGGVVQAKNMVARAASSIRKMDISDLMTAADVLATLYYIASELFSDSDRNIEEHLVAFGTSDSLMDIATVAHTWALSDEGKDKADEVYDDLNDLFTDVNGEDMQAILNVLIVPHLARLRAAGFLFNLPSVESRALWWDSIERSDDGVDTSGLTSAEILFFGRVIFGFLGLDQDVFSDDEQRLWSTPSLVSRTPESATKRMIRARIAHNFPAGQSGALLALLEEI